jgi:hypothetical protein
MKCFSRITQHGTVIGAAIYLSCLVVYSNAHRTSGRCDSQFPIPKLPSRMCPPSASTFSFSFAYQNSNHQPMQCFTLDMSKISMCLVYEPKNLILTIWGVSKKTKQGSPDWTSTRCLKDHDTIGLTCKRESQP